MKEFLGTIKTRTPIEVALQIDEDGHTTARALYEFLEMPTQNFARWAKTNIENNDFYEENTDWWGFFIVKNGNNCKDYKLTTDFAKHLCMESQSSKGKIARQYFVAIENKAKEMVLNRSQLSTQMQMILNMAESMAKQELEQKRQAEQIQQIERKQEVITEALAKASGEEEFKNWCKRQISRIVTIGEFNKGATLSEKFQLAWNESFERLMEKRPCNLKQRVANEKGRALVNGKTKSWIDKNINSLNVICADMNLRPVYESALREMAIYYCI